MCHFEGQRESPSSPEFGKMGGEGADLPPPAQIGLKMSQSKKFCFGIFMTLGPKKKVRLHFNVNSKIVGDNLDFAL